MIHFNWMEFFAMQRSAKLKAQRYPKQIDGARVRIKLQKQNNSVETNVQAAINALSPSLFHTLDLRACWHLEIAGMS